MARDSSASRAKSCANMRWAMEEVDLEFDTLSTGKLSLSGGEMRVA